MTAKITLDAETYYNETMYLKIWIWILAALLAVSLFFAWIGWQKYKETRQVKEGLEQILINQFRTIE